MIKRIDDPRNLLILTGFICQGFFNENYYAPAAFVIAWILCLAFVQKKQFISKGLEFFILLGALVLSITLAGPGIFAKCFSLGNGLVVFQCLRMLWPIDKRSKYYSIAIALTQIAVGSQVILGYSFIVVISAIFLLLPKSLYNLFAEEENPSYDPFSREAYWVFSHKFQFLGIAIVTILFFVLFPRVKMFNTMDLYGFNKKIEITKPTLTTSLGGDNQNNDIIFRVYGKNIGYLKLFSLDTFDGNVWTPSPASFLYRYPNLPYSNTERHEYRKIDIAAENFTSRFLPSDGYVTKINGDFFYEPVFSQQGNIIISEVLGAQNKYYEYWTIIPPPVLKMGQKDIKRYLQLPKVSKELKDFLESITNKNSSPDEKALEIRNYLNSHFTYETGGPELDSKSPIDDFIFHEKKGHCGRFASALAVLLRMENIPSRIVIGYYTNEKNLFGDFYNLRNSNTHAWVEAYFKEKGWIILDATPEDQRAFGAFNSTTDSTFTMIYDFIEYVWYSKIVNFTSSDQKMIFESIFSGLKKIIPGVGLRNLIYIASGLILLVCLLFFRKLFAFNYIYQKDKKKNIKYANHFYSKMLKHLAKNKLIRKPNTTPFEFIALLEKTKFSEIDRAKLITNAFCKAKYAEQILTQQEKKDIISSLESIKNMKRNKSRSS